MRFTRGLFAFYLLPFLVVGLLIWAACSDMG